LPIAESLATGIPCLTANFGSMAEGAVDGGCVTCDVNDVAALKRDANVVGRRAEVTRATGMLSPLWSSQASEQMAWRYLRLRWCERANGQTKKS
jgi:hypothetical protein